MLVTTEELEGIWFSIPKKTFEKLLKHYLNQMNEQTNEDTTYYTKSIEHERYMETLHSFTEYYTVIFLRKLETKEGYHFK